MTEQNKDHIVIEIDDDLNGIAAMRVKASFIEKCKDNALLLALLALTAVFAFISTSNYCQRTLKGSMSAENTSQSDSDRWDRGIELEEAKQEKARQRGIELEEARQEKARQERHYLIAIANDEVQTTAEQKQYALDRWLKTYRDQKWDGIAYTENGKNGIDVWVDLFNSPRIKLITCRKGTDEAELFVQKLMRACNESKWNKWWAKNSVEWRATRKGYGKMVMILKSGEEKSWTWQHESKGEWVERMCTRGGTLLTEKQERICKAEYQKIVTAWMKRATEGWSFNALFKMNREISYRNLEDGAFAVRMKIENVDTGVWETEEWTCLTRGSAWALQEILRHTKPIGSAKDLLARA